MPYPIIRAAQALAVWKAIESGAMGKMEPADRKAAEARACEEFVQAAYAVSFNLVLDFVRYEEEIAYRAAQGHPKDTDQNGAEITTKNEVRYKAFTGDGGFLVQKMNLNPGNPGVRLIPGEVPTENFLQLLIDLPDLLDTLPIVYKQVSKRSGRPYGHTDW